MYICVSIVEDPSWLCAPYAAIVVLIGPSGGKWQVKLVKRSSGNKYLDDGRKEFVNGHSLKESHFLIFKYIGGMRFTVQIFYETGCEMEDAFTINPNQEPGSYKRLDERIKCKRRYWLVVSGTWVLMEHLFTLISKLLIIIIAFSFYELICICWFYTSEPK